MPIDPSIAANAGYRAPTPIDFGQIAQQREAVRNAMLQGQIRRNQIQDYNRFVQETTAEGFDPNDPATQARLAALPDGREFLSSLGTAQTYNNNRDSNARETSDFTERQIRQNAPSDVDPAHMTQAREHVLAIPGVDTALANRVFDRLEMEPDPLRRLQIMQQFIRQDPQARAALEATMPKPSQINQGDHIVVWDSNPQSPGYGHEIGSYPVQLSPSQAYSLNQRGAAEDFAEGAGTPPGIQPIRPLPRRTSPMARPAAPGSRLTTNPPGAVSALPPRFRPVPGT